MYPRFLGSSQNQEQLALRVKSLLYMLIPIIVLVVKLQGAEVTEGNLQSYADAVYNVIIYGGFLVTGALHVWGWIRSFIKR